MNKKGFMVTIEAVIAIVIVLIFMLTTLLPKTQEPKIPENIKLSQEKIIEEIESNESLRENILNYHSQIPDYTLGNLEETQQRQQLSSFIKSSLDSPILDFNYTVCSETNTNCLPEFLEQGSDCQICAELPNKQVYAKSIMISGSPNPRIFRLYLWETF